jgi:3-hydroxyacyl-[acyl-carrier-protein] dehydratase
MNLPYDIRKIMEFLPHRYPFILVDRVLELVPGERIVALKNVTINEPFFQGHFPGNPIMPGVLVIEAMAQAGGILANESSNKESKGDIIYFMGLDNVRFRKPVVPGDQLMLHMKLLRMRSKAAKMEGVAMVNDQPVAEAVMMASFGESA